jgi:hypothetical protein
MLVVLVTVRAYYVSIKFSILNSSRCHSIRFRVVTILTIGAAAAVGCTQTNVALMDNSVHLARTCANGVKIFSSPSQVGVAYQEVALLNSTGSTGFTTEAGMMKSMREKAADVGANGIIMGNIDEPSAGAKVAAAVFRTSTDRKGKSVAIFIATDTARSKAACASAK